jgi:hypothetical protein
MDRRNFLQGLGSVAVTGALAEQAGAALPVGQVAPETPALRKSFVRVCGVGAGGSTMVNHLMAMGAEGVNEYVCVTTSPADLDTSKASRKLLVGHGKEYSTESPAEVRRRNRGEIQALLDGGDVVVVIAGPGSEAEAVITTDVVSTARMSGQQAASLLLMPIYRRDTDNEMGESSGMLAARTNSHVSMVISTEAIQASLGHQGTMAEFLAATDNTALRALRAILAMTSSGEGLLHATPEGTSHASAKIYAAELLREVTRCAREIELAICEMKSSADSLREEAAHLESATNEHYLASDAFHSAQADMYLANAKVRRMEFSGKGFESHTDLKGMLADREQKVRTLQARRTVVECAADELTRLSYNCRALKSNIEHVRESVSYWSEDLTARLSELKNSATLIGNDSDLPKAITHATTVLARAESVLGDIEIAKLVQGVEKDLA